MEKLTANEIANAVEGAIMFGSETEFICHVSTDSREIKEHTLFVPLKGEKIDGHEFIGKAIENGASIILSEKDVKMTDKVCVIKVADTTHALGKLAKFYLAKMNVKVVAVTGSVGKTSTKEMIASVLSQRFQVVKTQGNFNNHIGLPKTIFQIEEGDEIAVLEMGMNHFGEIDYLADIANPDIAIITNIGVSHIENLGSREGILKAKMEVDKHLKQGGKLVLNADNDLLNRTLPTIKDHVLTYGIQNKEAQYVASDVYSSSEGVGFTFEMAQKTYTPVIHALGEYHVYNAICAVAVGHYFGMKPEEIVCGIEQFKNAAMRMNVKKVKDLTIIVDCYNAAPDSMKEAIKVLGTLGDGRKVAVLGDMMEMGDYADAAHDKVGRAVATHHINILVAIGAQAKHIANGALEGGLSRTQIFSFKTNEEFLKEFPHIVQEGDTILLKASRAMAFEKILNYIER